MGGGSLIVYSSAVATVLFSIAWHAANIEGCFSGRYGRYENWPSIADWEELLLLLTGKYWDGNGNGGWGWSSSNSLGGGLSSSFGGGGGLGSFSSGYKGGSSYFSSPASQTSLGGSHGGLSAVESEKMKQALSAYFSKNKYKPVSSTSFGSGGGIGQSFIDSPGYGLSHPKKPTHHHDGPSHSFGPPYADSPSPPSVPGWPNDSPHSSKPGFDNNLDHGPPHSFNHGPPLDPGPPFDHDPTKDKSPYHNPSPYDTDSAHNYDSGPANDHGPPYNDHGPPYDSSKDHGPPYNDGPSNHGSPFPSNDHGSPFGARPSNDHGSPFDNGPPDPPFKHPGPFNHGPPRENHYSRPRPPKDNFNNNPFQSDYDTFGGFNDKRRRQGRRRWFDGKAGLPTKPKVPAHKALRQKPPPLRRRMQRNRRLHERHQRMSRRKINTSFGGYKVDHSRLRYG